MNYYKNLFNFRGKNVFILGGSGLIGQEVSKAILDLEGRVINLDIKNNSKKVDKSLDPKLKQTKQLIKECIQVYNDRAKELKDLLKKIK